jgi:hypothetical protein
MNAHNPAQGKAIVIVDQTPKMLNSPDWPYGFYGYNATNAGTFFANGVPNNRPWAGLGEVSRRARSADRAARWSTSVPRYGRAGDDQATQ